MQANSQYFNTILSARSSQLTNFLRSQNDDIYVVYIYFSSDNVKGSFTFYVITFWTLRPSIVSVQLGTLVHFTMITTIIYIHDIHSIPQYSTSSINSLRRRVGAQVLPASAKFLVNPSPNWVPYGGFISYMYNHMYTVCGCHFW